MADINNEIKVVFKGQNSNVVSSIRGVNQSLDKLRGKLDQTKDAMNTLAGESAKAFAAVSAAVGGSVIAFSKFEDGLTNVKTLLSGTDEELKKAGDRLDTLAKKTLRESKFSIDETTEALFFLVSTTADVTKQNERFEAAIKLAKGGVTDLSLATQAITGAMNAYGIETKSADQVARTFFVAQKFGATTVERLALNLGKVIPFSRRAGFSLEETAAAVSQLTIGGINTEIAVTALKGAITGLLSPTKEAEEEFTRLGIPFGETALKGKSMGEVLELIALAAREGNSSIGEMFGNIRAQTAIGALNTEALENYNMILRQTQEDTTSLNRAVAAQEKTVSAAMGKMRNALALFGITLGEKLAPMLTDVAEKITKVAHAMAELDPETIETLAKALFKLAVTLGTIAVATKAVATITTLGSALTKLVLLNPKLAVVAGTVAAIAFAINKLNESIPEETKLRSQVEMIENMIRITKLGGDPDNKLPELRKQLVDANKALEAFLAGTTDDPEKTVSFFSEIRDAIADIQTAFEKIKFPTITDTDEEGDADPGENPLSKALEDATEKTDPLIEALGAVATFAADAFKGMGEAIQSSWSEVIDNWIKGGKTFGEFIQGLFQSIADQFRALVAKMIASNLFRFLVSLLPGGGTFAFTLPSFDVGTDNVPNDMVANIHKGEIITPARESEGIRNGTLGLVNLEKMQGMGNQALEKIAAKIDNLSTRPIQFVANIGDATLDLVSKEITKSQVRVAEQGI